MANLYKVAAERNETVIRSHDPRFMESLVELLQGNPIHPAIEDEIRALARDLGEVLNGHFKSCAKEL
jgi:hypothetical protein